MDMEEETRRELSALQRERELLQAKEKENIDAIDEVSEAMGYHICVHWFRDRVTAFESVSP